MFCSSCGKKIDDDSVFCSGCGKKIKREPENDIPQPFTEISPETSQTTDTSETEILYTPENNSQPEFSQENSEKYCSEKTELEKFFGSTEPIDHINPEPVPEIPEQPPEKHTRESLPDLVLRKKSEKPGEIYQEEIYQEQEEDYPEENYPESPESYNDNDDTQYIPYEDIQNDYDENYDSPPEYDDTPQYDYPPEYPEDQPYFTPPPPPPVQPVSKPAPVKVGALRLFGAGTVTFFTTIFFIVLSLLFCIKLGFSGTVVEKNIKNLDTEKILEAEYDGNHDVNEFLYEKTGFYNISFGMANENDFRNFLLNLDMLDFIGENAAVYADYLLDSGKKPTLTSEDIAEYMFNNSVYNNLNRQDFSTMMYNLGDGQPESILSVDEWERQTGFDFAISGYVFSFLTLGILLAFIMVMFIWIAVIVDKRGRYLTGFYKNIFMTSGIILLITGAVCIIAPPIVYSHTSHVAFYLSSKLLKDFNLFMLVTGAFEVIAGIILGLIKTLIIRYERKNRDG